VASLTELASKAMGKPVASDPEAQPTKKVSPPIKPPKDVQKRIDRGRERLKQVAPRRKLASDFTNGNHYGWIGEDQVTYNQSSTVTFSNGGGMPDHRIRRSHDLLGPIIKRKIAASTAKIPGYEIIPSTDGEEAFLASQVAEKVAYAGYEKWEIKRATKRLLWNALVTDEGFIGARWDSSVGPYVDVSQHPEDPTQPDPENPQYIGKGEIKIVVYGGLEVIWEPGVEFEESRWMGIDTARPVSLVEEEESFIVTGTKLKADAETSSVPKPQRLRTGTEMVMVTEYLERPCNKWPMGRRLIYANGRQIFPEETYPCVDNEGNVVDEPALHRLFYAVDAASDRNKGLVISLIDPMRSYDQAANKAEEGVELGMNPQLMVPIGALSEETPVTDEPGIVIEYDPMVSPNAEPKWKQDYSVPADIYRQQENASTELERISFDYEVPSGLHSAQAIAAIFERNEASWADFIADLAEVHAALMRDCLTLVQRYYSEQRLLKFKGAAGWENLAEFRGADIKGQTDVQVLPGSLEGRTRQALENKIVSINNMFPGYFPPPVVIAALNSAQPERLVESYEKDEIRAYRIIALIKSGAFWSVPPRPLVPGEEAPLLDPVTEEPVINYKTGEPFQMTSVPGWMPRPFDNADLHKQILESWMKTSDYEELDEEAKQAAMLYYKALLDLETKAAQRRAELQTQMAEQAGAANAAKAGEPKTMPDMPSPSSAGTEAPSEPQPA
jgi:hypothetical protein